MKTIPVKKEHATIQRVVLIVLVMKGGQRKAMEKSVLRTLTNASLTITILVGMETAQIQRVVSNATVTQAGKRKKEVFTLLLAHNLSHYDQD